tara:strand:- start:3337 stop:5409 length:2073 start_codon:yes stop_codon:yes gene_type:complete
MQLCAVTLASSAVSHADDTDFDTDFDEVDLADGATIVIEATKNTKELGTSVVDATVAEETAGVQGDALKAVTVQGSVARSSGNSVGISVWGAAPADTRVYVDDVPVPRFFHMGGTRSILPSSEVESFTLISGGASARYGRGIGGAIEVRTPEPSWEAMRMQFRVDPIDVGGSFGTRLGEKGSISFAARSSVLPMGFNAVASERAEQVFAVPDYSDFQSRLSYNLSDGQVLRVLGMLSVDDLERGIPSRIESERFSESANSGFGRLAVSLLRGEGADSRKLTVWVGRDAASTRQDFGLVAAEERLRKDAVGVLLIRKKPLSPSIDLELGLDSEVSRSRWLRQGAIALPAREGDISTFGQPPGDRVNEDDWTVTMASVAIYSTLAFKLGSALRIEPGLRFEPSIINGNRILPVRPTEPEVGYSEQQWALSPRARVVYQPHNAAAFYASGGRYSQAPGAEDASPVFGSPVLERANAWQLLVGTDLRPFDKLRVGLQGFVSRQSNLAVRSGDATPGLASLLTSNGSGRTIGANFSALASLGRGVDVTANYTLMKAERRKPGTAWRLFDLDQRHTARASARWKSMSGIALAARVEVTSGFPRTPVEDSVFNSQSQRYDPIFGAQNSERLPTFAELSLRIGYEGEVAWGRYRLWLDVVNASNRSNAQERYYSADYMRLSHVRGLPILPLLGAELQL